MSIPILKTKLHIPTIHQKIVSRPRLYESLASGIGGKFTLISAPAGFGKSTLLSAWTQRNTSMEQVAWLSLDDGDNALESFLTYFIAALQTIHNEFGRGVLIALQSSGIVDVEILLTSLINEISEFPEKVILILDDYHVIESNAIDETLTFLIDNLPSKMHLVISSRIDPTFPLSLFRACRQMTELRANDLRFTPEETAVFLNKILGFELSTEDVADLEAHTEGWIAGLQLAALSMKSSEDAKGFIRSFTGSNRYILDYLGEEVLSLQPGKIQKFLLRTSILRRLTGPLCDVLTESGNGEETLEILDRENLFIIPLDDERQWYRYHHLFGDFLKRCLRITYPA